MRPHSRTVLAVMVAVLLSACSTAAPPAASVEPPPAVVQTPSPVPLAPTETPTSPPTAAPTASPSGHTGLIHGSAEPVAVTIVDFDIEPARIEVAVGGVVRWTNEGGQPHTVKSVDGSISSAVVLREPFEWTAVGEAREIDYVCGIHPAMTGTIAIVE